MNNQGRWQGVCLGVANCLDVASPVLKNSLGRGVDDSDTFFSDLNERCGKIYIIG